MMSVERTLFSNFEAGDVPILAYFCCKVPENTMNSVLPYKIMATNICDGHKMPIVPATSVAVCVLDAFKSLLFKLMCNLMHHFDSKSFLIII
jgi:hypothetical protein